TNPIQIGTGTKVSSIDKNFTQGNMTPTGRPLDLSIDGDGFFMLSDGSQNFFTRVGSFNLDKNNDLVDSGTGLKVLGTSGVAINVPVNDTQPGNATTTTSISGNLNSEFTSGAVNHVLTGGSAYSVQGTGTTRTLTGSITPIASTTVTGVGTAFSTELAVGDQINIGGQIRKVTAIASNTSLTVDAATTVAVADAALTAGTGALTGSVTTTASTTVTGSGTAFTTELAVGDQITVNNETQTITAIASDTSLTVGTAYTATGTDTSAMTDSMAVAGLNDLLDTVNTTDYVTGDVINVVGTEHDGTTVTTSFTYGAANDGTTLGDLKDFITSNFGSATASIDSSGNLVVTSDQAGQSELILNLTDGTSNTGATTFSSFSASTTGSGDVYVSSMPVFDTQGSSHLISLSFEKTASNTWNVTPTMSAAEGSVTDAITAITFNSNGSFASTTGTSTITITYPDATTQTVTLDFGTPNTFSGLTQFGGTGSA
ncbi:MAG: hypothetical protein GY727_11310, partial [Gammaproteobacteria bacterium]|nr:hypothetical protein [Gammaproteobacteria bacterium]